MQKPLPVDPFHDWQTGDGEPVAGFYRIDGGFLLRFVDRADFTVDVERSRVSCMPVPDVSQRVIDAIYFNQVLPLLESEQGALVFHASAVSVMGNAIAFLGQSGEGKSTLAAHFARAGYPFLSDDGLWLERDASSSFFARSHRPYLRLWPDSEASVFKQGIPEASEDQSDDEKHLLAASNMLPFESKAMPLSAIFVLGDERDDSIEIVRLKPSDALSALLRNSFILEVDDKMRVKDHFDMIVDLVADVPCYDLCYPRNFQYLQRLTQRILEQVVPEMSPS